MDAGVNAISGYKLKKKDVRILLLCRVVIIIFIFTLLDDSSHLSVDSYVSTQQTGSCGCPLPLQTAAVTDGT